MGKHTKLELTWIGKQDRPRLEPRILIEEPEKSYHAPHRYIDPPYNTGAALEHYEDGIEHSLWLSMMRDRLELLRKLLREDGSIWISIDDHEMPYLRILLDELFGRRNFMALRHV